MPKRMRLVFPHDGVSALAELLEQQAPRTCEVIWAHLPLAGQLEHGQWSGPETYLPIDPRIRIPAEHQTFHTIPGDIGFYALEGGRLVGWPDDMSELAFFYDRGARPSMIDGPVPVNLFARIVEGLTEFADLSRRIRREGVKPFGVERGP
jgi:Protein of unknown function (DUF3830)